MAAFKTILTRRGGVDEKGPGSPGKARWRDRVIWDGRVQRFGLGGRVWRRPKKVNLGRKWVETEDEGAASCEKLRVVLAVLLEVAVCLNTPFRFLCITLLCCASHCSAVLCMAL